MWVWLFSLGGVSFLGYLSLSYGHYALRLREYVWVCARPKVHMTVRWGADFHPKSLSSPPTSPTGFVLIPLPVVLLSHLLSPVHTTLYVCAGSQGCMHSAPLSLLCSKFTPSCPYSHCQFLPCSFVNVCSAGLIKAEQGMARFPAHSAIRSLKGIFLLLFLCSPRLFSERERQLLSHLFLWILAENLLLDSSCVLRSLSWMMHALVCWKSCKNRLLLPQQCSVCYPSVCFAFSVSHHIIRPIPRNFNGFLVKVHAPNASLSLMEY